jgi:cell wall-associated NlpC family hydrolase
MDNLMTVAESWLGTPFRANGARKGPRGGVACHGLPFLIYQELGWFPPELAMPTGLPHWSQPAPGGSQIERWCREQRELLEPVPPGEAEPGAMLGFRVHRNIHHLGLLVAPDRMIHCTVGSITTIEPVAGTPWGRRLAAAWRPVKQS